MREAAPTNNYGRAGALSVGGVGATNGFGVLGGRVESLARFRLKDALAALDAAMGGHEWFIAGASLQLYEMGAPNNPLFNRGIGALEVRWLASGDDWQEGTGSPSAPATDGVSFSDVASLVDPRKDLSLGVFTNNGADGSLRFNLHLPAAFVDDLQSGSPTTLHFVPASDSIGFTFLSRTDPRTNLHTALALTVVAGAPPQIEAIEPTTGSELIVRFQTRSNWTHELQSCDTLSVEPPDQWRTLFTAPAQAVDGRVEFLDGKTNRQRFYRLRLSP